MKPPGTERPAPVLRIGGDDTNADWMGDAETKKAAASWLLEHGHVTKENPQRRPRHQRPKRA